MNCLTAWRHCITSLGQQQRAFAGVGSHRPKDGQVKVEESMQL